MRSHARASSAGSSTRRAMGLGRVIRGAIALRGRSRRTDGSGAPSHAFLVTLLVAVCALGLLAAPASAALPTHPERPTLNLSGFERACGLAVDSAGNRYVSDFTTNEVKIFSPSGTEITHFTPSVNTVGPCALAVDSSGNVYVNGRGTDVVKYKPSAPFPPTGSTTYAADTSTVSGTGVIASAGAGGVAVDPATGDVYVGFSGHISSYQPDGTLISATLGEAAGVQFLSVAVSGSTGKIYGFGSGVIYVFSPDGATIVAEIDGSDTEAGSLELGQRGLTIDQSNGHVYFADIGPAGGHRVVDEFDSGGELVSEIPSPAALIGTAPTAVAVDNSGGPNNGDVFFSAGQSPSSVLAFGPLPPPTHPERPTLNLSGFERACGLAVDSAGNRYVSDFTTNEVKIFSPSGTEITHFTPSVNTEKPCALAVDSSGNVYVNGRNKDVVKYKPSAPFPPTGATTYSADTSTASGTGVIVSLGASGVAVDPATDEVYVGASGHISSYQPDGTLISATLGEAAGVTFVSVAVSGSTGKIYGFGSGVIYVFSPDGATIVAEIDGSDTEAGSLELGQRGLTVDQSNGHVYFADIGASGHRVVDEFDSGGELVSEIPTPSALEGTAPTAVAVDNSGGLNDGDVFFSAGLSPSSVLAFGPLTYAEFLDLEVKKTGPGQGTVTSSPLGVNCGAVCKAPFEKGIDVILTATPSAGSSFESWQGCDSVAVNECTVTLAKARRVTAKFNTKPKIESEYVRPHVTSALLEATINPDGEPTSYQFEYLSEDAYQANGESFTGPEEATKVPVSPEAIGNGYDGVSLSAEIEGLEAHTAYRFRVVATNPLGIDEGKAFFFITYLPPNVFEPCSNDDFRTGAGASQPDCRAYEQATPTDKNGGDVAGDADYVRASDDGSRISFETYVPIPGGEGAQTFTPAYLASRGASGWSTQGLLPPQSLGVEARISSWTPDFTHVFAWGRRLGETRTTGLFERNTATGAVDTIVPHTFGFSEPVVADMSADGSIVAFEYRGSKALAPETVSTNYNLYVWDREAGIYRLAGVLNNGKAPPGGATAGAGDLDPGGAYTRDQNALSADGKVLYFTTGGAEQLYVRINPTEAQSPLDEGECADPDLACTYHVSESQRTSKGPDPAGPQHAHFRWATPGGSAFFISSEMLTDDANTGPEQEPAQIGRAKVSGSEPENETLDFMLAHAVDVAISPDGEYIYWANPGESTIGRAKLPVDESEAPSDVNPNFIEIPPTEFETRPYSEPGVIHQVPSTPRYLAVDSEYVYWTNTGLADEEYLFGGVKIEISPYPAEGGGTIGRAKRDLSGPEPIDPEFITGATNPKGIAIDGGHLYWVNERYEFGDRGLGRAGLEGEAVDPSYCTANELGHSGAATMRDLAAFEGDGYLALVSSQSNPESDGRLERIHLSSCALLGSAYLGGVEPRGVAADGTYAYWSANKEGHGTIARMDVADLEDFGPCNGFASCDEDFAEPGGVLGGMALDGEHLYWASNGEGSANPGRDLYRYDPDTNQLTDLAPDPDGNGAEVQGVLGSSEDGSYLYFAANGVLAQGASQGNCRELLSATEFSGKCNIYLYHEGEVSFIAQVNASAHDGADWSAQASRAQGGGVAMDSRVSPDGRTLVFGSTEQLTDYDNQGVSEIYRYRVGEPGVLCISCNPNGLPPSGGPSFSNVGTLGLSSSAPAATLTRTLSADGNRVFFQTPESLVGEDANATLVIGGQSGTEPCPSAPLGGRVCQDVYEWEASGTGSCESEAQNGGCLYLISTGKSKEPAYLADASESGDDVFFFTRDRLAPQDEDSLFDVYDARVGGGLAAENGGPPPPPCEGEACKGGASSPPESASPSTSLFSGPGNQAPHHKKQSKKHRKKHKHRRHAKHNGRAHR